jgi:hypothetical protein
MILKSTYIDFMSMRFFGGEPDHHLCPFLDGTEQQANDWDSVKADIENLTLERLAPIAPFRAVQKILSYKQAFCFTELVEFVIARNGKKYTDSLSTS